MNPLKRSGPVRLPGHDPKNQSAFNGEDYRHSINNPQVACPKCAFYELIRRKKGYVYGLCHFTGLRHPQPGQDGCRFIPGCWENIDSILGLTQGRSINNLDFPNLVRLCSGLDCSQDGQKVAIDSTAIHAYADKNGNQALQIGRAQRPHVREAAAASLRPGSVGALPFCVNHPELSEV